MTELFGGLLKPGAGAQLAIRRELERRRDRWDRPGFLYRGAGDLLLQHGRFYSGHPLPEEYQSLRGQMGFCFDNALKAAVSGGLAYCEGVYSFGHGHFNTHAWCVDAEGHVIEVSVPYQPGAYLALPHGGRTPFPPPERHSYWGVALHPDYVAAYRQSLGPHRADPCIDRDPMDAVVGVQLGGRYEDYEEDRTDWPILRTPYDPNRRTL